MRILRGRPGTGRKAAVGTVAAASALALTAMTVSPAAAAGRPDNGPQQDAEAWGQLIQSELLGTQLADVASAYSSSPGSTEASSTPLDVEALNALKVSLGDGVSLPLVSDADGGGLLHLGNAGALNAYGHAPQYNDAKSSAGAVGSDGALNLDDINEGKFGNANVDLTAVLKQLGLNGVTDQVVNDLSLELGAIASTANSNGTEYTPEYVVADGTLTVSSPAVVGISDALDTVVDGTGGTLEEVIGDEGLLNQLAGIGLNVDLGSVGRIAIGGDDAKVSVEVRDALNSVVENAIKEKLEDKSGIVSIDLASGKIAIDLAKVVEGGNGEDLNGLDPNTQVLTSDTISKITTAVSDALGELTGTLTDTLTDALNNVHLKIELPAEIRALVPLAKGEIVIDATLGQLAGTDDTDPKITTTLDLIGIIPLGDLLNLITEPVLDAVLGITKPLISDILEATAEEVSGAVTGIVDPILDSLDPVFGALNQVVDLTINEQSPVPTPPASGASAQSALENSYVDGDNGDGFTVNAVSLELLPAANAIDINLASSSVRATAEAPEEPGDDDVNTNAAASAAASVSPRPWAACCPKGPAQGRL